MMGVGLLFSYRQGAWVGTAIGLVYLAKVHGKLKWWVGFARCPGVYSGGGGWFWHSTADNGPWYLKRLDLSRPRRNHRGCRLARRGSNDADHPSASAFGGEYFSRKFSTALSRPTPKG